jgi:negative regulator of flagellin synthesis FlgM
MDIKTLIGNNPRADGTTTGIKSRGTISVADPVSVKTNGTASESVTLTAAAKSLSAARESAQDVPFDSARVERIKTAISEGRYPIDNQRLAKSMLNFEGMMS